MDYTEPASGEAFIYITPERRSIHDRVVEGFEDKR
jgi:hypothetical protein